MQQRVIGQLAVGAEPYEAAVGAGPGVHGRSHMPHAIGTCGEISPAAGPFSRRSRWAGVSVSSGRGTSGIALA